MKKIAILLYISLITAGIIGAEEELTSLISQAERGDAEAQLKLAMRYDKGDGVDQDHRKAFEWALKAAEKDNIMAMMYVATYYNTRTHNREASIQWWKKAGERGALTAQFILAKLYSEGESPDYEQAYEWYLKAAEKGFALALLEVGNYCCTGTGCKLDAKAGREWFMKAALQTPEEALKIVSEGQENDLYKASLKAQSAARHALGMMFLNGIGGDKDEEQALMWIKRSAEDGYAPAQAAYAYLLMQGLCGLEIDQEQALKWAKLGAEQNNPDALLLMSNMCFAGIGGTPPDNELGMMYLRRAAVCGSRPAQHDLGVKYFMGDGVEKDRTEALKWLELAANAGDVDAQYICGNIYYNDQATPENCSRAYKWFVMAEKGGRLDATRYLGIMHIRGDAPESNYAEGMARLKKLAEEGDVYSQYVLGIAIADMGYDGKRQASDAEKLEGMEWVRKSADNGCAEAQYSLGQAYEVGYIVEQNEELAKEWYSKAAEQGHLRAKMKL